MIISQVILNIHIRPTIIRSLVLKSTDIHP